MYFKTGIIVILLCCTTCVFGQSNMHFSNAALANIIAGNYAPEEFQMLTDYGTPEHLVGEIENAISPDTLEAILFALQQFHTRNTGSDTMPQNHGIGDARNWVLAQFRRFGGTSQGRLISGFFEFDQDICVMGHHKNVVAMLPGTQPDAGVIIIESHLDTRCEVVCDTGCLAQGIDDNGSGTALVLELARVLSRYNYDRTLVFMTTTGEEQGLYGAEALAQYTEARGIRIDMVQNNDIVGGIICGETSSPPSCPGLNDIDSTQVRLFSYGGFDSPGKGVCRYIKLQYDEMLRPIAKVPMQLTIMSAEDRTGRGGDHIPFREHGYPAMRFTSANENGDAGINPNYHDRQHSSRDILGVDRNGDTVVDSFFVDFDYLARNTAINGTSAVMAAIAPETPTITGVYFDAHTFYIEFESPRVYPNYRIGLRTDFNDFDTLYSTQGATSGFFSTANAEFFIFLSVMAVDSNGVESLPSEEVKALFSSTEDTHADQQKAYLLQNKPNPFDESTIIGYWVESAWHYNHAEIVISDINGAVVTRIPTTPQQGMNEVLYRHGYQATGVCVYALVVDGKVIDQKRMVFAN